MLCGKTLWSKTSYRVSRPLNSLTLANKIVWLFNEFSYDDCTMTSENSNDETRINADWVCIQDNTPNMGYYSFHPMNQ